MRKEVLDFIIAMPAMNRAAEYHRNARDLYDTKHDADMDYHQFCSIMAIIGFVDGGGSVETVTNIMKQYRAPAPEKTAQIRLVKD